MDLDSFLRIHLAFHCSITITSVRKVSTVNGLTEFTVVYKSYTKKTL